MKFLYLHILLLAFSAACCPALHAQVVVETHLDTAQILIGEQVQLRMVCVANSGQKVSFPRYQAYGEIAPGVEVVGQGNIDTTYTDNGRRMRLERKYTITSFDSALYTIPPCSVMVDGKSFASRTALGLKVSTVAVDTVHVDKFAPAHDVVEMPFRWSAMHVLLLLACWLFTGLSLALFLRRSDPRLITRRMVVTPPAPPHVAALSEIQRLQSDADSDGKQWYTHLTEELRRYMEQRFGFNALELTTDEIIARLEQLEPAALAELHEVLRTADLVKFAKYAPTLSDRERSFVSALTFVQQTKVEAQQQEAPHVEFVTLSDRRQHRLRVLMTLGAVLSAGIACMVGCWLAYSLYVSFC